MYIYLIRTDERSEKVSYTRQPHIKKVKVQNYKNLHDVDLNLQPLNILIGPNGSGKSNFLSLFALLCAGAKEDGLSIAIRQQGGIDDLLWRGRSNRADSLSIELDFESLRQTKPSKRDEETYYKVRLSRQANTFVVDSEELMQPKDSASDSHLYTYLKARTGNVTFLRSLESFEDDLKSYNSQEFIVSQIRDKERYPLLDEVRQLLSGWIAFRGFGENAIANIREPQPLDVTYPIRLHPDGKNLVSVLHSLSNNARFDQNYDRLQHIMKTAFPDFKKFDFQQPEGSRLMALHWRMQNGTDFAAYSLSDGMIRFLGLVTLLLSPEPPSLITIDEPEIGLHPKLIPLLLELLRYASERTQIIVTTHSPLLLDEDYISLEQVILTERGDDGIARIGTASSLSHLNSWLEDFTLGNLWTMGKLALD